MKSTLAVLVIVTALLFTGCFGSGNSASSGPAEPLDITVPPEGFSFTVPDGYEESQISVTSVLYKKGDSRLVYSFSQLTPDIAQAFSDAAGASDISKFSEQYSLGMDEYEAGKVDFFSRTGLKLTAVLTEDTAHGRAGEQAILLVLPLQKHVIQLEAYGPESGELAESVLNGSAYNPPAE